MTNGVFLTIEDKGAMVKLVKGCVRGGYLRKFDLRDVSALIERLEYPLQIPIDVMSVIELGSNKLVRGVFGKQIDEGLTKFINNMEAG